MQNNLRPVLSSERTKERTSG